MSAPSIAYNKVVARLIEASSRAVLGLRGFRSEPLREHLRGLLEQPPGEGQSLLAEPVFEAAFGWEQADQNLGDLEGKLLHAEVVRALAEPIQRDMAEDYSFPRSRSPYKHQLEAWKALADKEVCRSVLVTSGTGSGKTECFLVPILNDLAQELTDRQDGGREGVRAIFLYPLNALIKSQKERLQAWSEPFGGRIRFSLYNGDTPQNAKTTWKCEVPDRRTLRDQPPQVLVTNPTILEYMLVRAEDRPILDKSQGKLRWIVIDEAHTYLGSQAAELTLLLRRTMHAFGCTPGNVHLVATSATIGNGSEESKAQLARFLADLAGVKESQVSVVVGRRELPAEIPAPVHTTKSAPDIDQWESLAPEQLYEVISREAPLVRLRKAVVVKPHKLSELAQFLFERSDANAKKQTLELIDLCTRARDADGRPFLPLRGHIFHRTFSGLWACANSACNGKAGSALDDPRWPFGAVFFERRERCTCGAPVFDVVQCGTCGAEYLAAEEVTEASGDRLRPPAEQAEDDEFQEQLEPFDAGADEGSQNTTYDPQRRLISAPDQGMASVGVSPDGSIDWGAKEGVLVHLRLADGNGLSCAVCRDAQAENYVIEQFRPVRIGAPFLLTSTTPTLLSMQPPLKRGNDAKPMDGRRLVTFTDSRQGTARTVAKAQQQVERDYVGSLLYHSLFSKKSVAASAETIEEKRHQIEALRSVAQGNAALQPVLANLERELDLLQSPAAGCLSWQEASDKLQSAEDFKRWMKSDLNELGYGQLSDQAVADLCLYREFFLRPRRQYSLEGLGLVQLVYPGLEHVSLPSLLQQRGIAKDEWINLLRLSVDVFVRSGSPSVEIPGNLHRWLGYPGKPTTLIPPNTQRTRPTQRYWPSTQSPYAGRNRLVRLLSHAFNLQLDRDADARVLDELLGTMWSALIHSKVLSPVEGGYQLALKEAAQIQTVAQAWLCPVTRRLLPVSFLGFTPYLPELPAPKDLAQCQKVDMPELPHPFWQGAQAEDPDAWLQGDPKVQELRRLGAWIDISDRIARFSRYFRAAEHSAQLSGPELTRREREFKDGSINLLSCSTTMEMGVDIGGLSTVAMNNVPPHPANFLQRAGRAGRRGETAALSFTLCKSNPHGEAVFRDPLWPFTAKLTTPRVDLRSVPIVQRHINALALATFLLESGPDSVPKLRCGWFFEPEDDHSSAPYSKFMNWCESPDAWPERFVSGVKSLTTGSRLEGAGAEELLAATSHAVQEAARRWLLEVEGLLAQQRALQTQDGNSTPEVAIRIRLDRWRKEYLLGQLASLAFLPGYGFPTGVVPLVTTTAEELESAKRKPSSDDREDNRQRRAGFPSRGLAIAIRDYAPGTDTVLNGRVYRSSGVTLNWQLPIEAQGAPEIQDLRWVWRCKRCGSNGLRLVRPDACPSCGRGSGNTLLVHRVLRPSGFAVDFRSRPHNDISLPQYIPVRDPLISIEGAEWMSLPEARLGRYRTAPTGQIFHHTDGLHGKGFSLCLRCGRADSVTLNGERPKSLEDHRRLQGGRLNDKERACPGNDESWAIIDGVQLGASYVTEIFELQLRDHTGRPVQDRGVAYTFAVALRRALCELIGIEEAEVGATAAESLDQNGASVFSVYLFDTASGGAGYSGQVPTLLHELVSRMRTSVLACPAKCDSACQACLLTYDTQHHLDLLDRHSVLTLLNDEFLVALDLPEELRIFGENSRLELEPLPLAVDREWQRWKFDRIRVYLGGPVESWECFQWRFRERLRRFHSRGVEVTLVMPAESLATLEQSQKEELYVLALELSANLLVVNEQTKSVGPISAVPILEIGDRAGAMRWAVSPSSSLAPNGDWGSGDAGAVFVRSERSSQPLEEIKGGTAMQLSELRPSPTPGVVEIEISRELDGPARDFGSRAWTLIIKRVPELGSLLQADCPLVRVSYTDRYLRSPLALLLIERLLSGLEKYPGGLNSESEVQIRTTDLGKPHHTSPQLWSHDWQDRQDRDDVVQHLFEELLARFNWDVQNHHDLPHARLLYLEWADGRSWQLRFDQGVGYWRESGQRGGQFPFQAAPAQQASSLRQARVSIIPVSAAHSTYWYAVKQNGATERSEQGD